MCTPGRAGRHIFTEKVLAPTIAQCHDVLAAVDRAGVALMVSLPRLYDVLEVILAAYRSVRQRRVVALADLEASAG
jgi:predicted dehydrogenase